MTSWRPQWSTFCPVCRHTVATRLTVWSARHQSRICHQHPTGPNPATYDPAAVVGEIIRKGTRT